MDEIIKFVSNFLLPAIGFLALGFTIWSLFKSIKIVPARTALVIERLGKYEKTLEAGFHCLIPFIDRTFSLDQIVAAHEYMESNKQIGKIVVTV